MTVPLGKDEYRALVEHSPVMIWRAGLDAKCDYFNETWLAFTGRTLAQEQGDGWAEGVHADDLAACVGKYLACFERRESFEMEYRLKRHDGVYRWIFDRGTPFFSGDGTFAGFIGSCVDIEDRRVAQAEREAQKSRELDSAQQFEKWLLGIVGHDIRNPLGSVSLAAHAILMRPEDPAVVKRNVDRVTRGVDRIKHIVNDLLDLSRERHGGIPVSPKPTDLNRICRQVIDELEAQAPGPALRLEITGDATGTWDEHRLLQAISNLVGNAIRHGASGAPIVVRVAPAPKAVAVEVHNGGHIAPEVRPRIFEAFTGTAGGSRRADGLGLGLFITRSIARAHGGTIEFDSAPERGTTFRLVLPRDPSEARQSAACGS